MRLLGEIGRVFEGRPAAIYRENTQGLLCYVYYAYYARMKSHLVTFSDAMTKRQGYGPLSAPLRTFRVFRSRLSLITNMIEIRDTPG
jgi:hypothetical protein